MSKVGAEVNQNQNSQVHDHSLETDLYIFFIVYLTQKTTTDFRVLRKKMN